MPPICGSSPPAPPRKNRSPQGRAVPKRLEHATALGRLVQALEAEPCLCDPCHPLHPVALPCEHMLDRDSRVPVRLWREILARWSPMDHGRRPKGKLPRGGPPVLPTEDATRAARVALYATMAEAMAEMPWNEARIAEAERRAGR